MNTAGIKQFSDATREVNHTKTEGELDSLAFVNLRYAVKAENANRLEAQPASAFATLHEAQNYALQCASYDPDQFYKVTDLETKSSVFHCKLPAGE